MWAVGMLLLKIGKSVSESAIESIATLAAVIAGVLAPWVSAESNFSLLAAVLVVSEGRADPVPVRMVRLFEPGRPARFYQVTGWSSGGKGTPCAAMYAPVSDSGQAAVHLV